MRVNISISTPIRNIESLPFEDRFGSEEIGLITAWEIGRKLALKEPDLAQRAMNGEFPLLPWKGGVEKKTKLGKKIGSFFYLAELQGLKSEDLSIDTDREIKMVCTVTGVEVTFTSDLSKLGQAQEQ